MTITNELFEKMRVQDSEQDNGGTALPESKPRYEILSALDALQPQPPIDWIVDGLISAGSVNVFYGEGGSKKTWALLDMGVCVARGDAWLNFKTQAGSVLVIDEESGRRRITRRMGEVLRGHSADSDTPIYCISLAAFDFGKPNDIGELYNLIANTKARLVIVDALADVMPGRDENAVKDVQPIFLSLRRIAEETQAAIVIIHHANKGGSYRGSTAIKGALDLLLSVDSKADSNEITFKTEKARDTTSSTFAASANFMPDMFWLIPSTASSFEVISKGQRYVLRYLLANGESPLKDISSNADSCSEVTARNSVYSLADQDFITRTNGGGQGAKAIYDLTDKGRETASKL
jgi:DNA-binding HxlR family transcriptional regulator